MERVGDAQIMGRPGPSRQPVSRKCDPVGAVEIAQRLGVSRRTVDQWRQRDIGFPEPRWRVGGRPAWNFDDVEAWHSKRPSEWKGKP